MAAQENPDRYSLAQQIAVTVVALAAMMPTVLQPLLLGALVRAERIDAVQLGQAATAEQLGMALTALCLGAWLPPARLKPILLGALSLCAVANLATSMVEGGQVIVARLVSGLSSGTGIWLITNMIARVERPARFMGLYVISQSITGLVFSAILSLWLLPAFGANGGLRAMAVFMLLAIVAVAAIPSRLSELPKSGGGRMPAKAGIVGLLAVVLYMGSALSIWTYVLPLAAASGLSPGVANGTVSAGLAAQMLGGLAATFARGWTAPRILASCTAVELAAVVAMATTSVPVLFIVAGSIFCFGLTLGISFFIPFLEVLDPSRRAGTLCGGAQLLGQSFGVYCASLAVGGLGVYGSAYTGMMFLALVLVMLVTALFLTKRVPAV